jgi:hypothetical protein
MGVGLPLLRSQLHCYSRMASLCHWHRLLMFITSEITVFQSASTRHEAFVLKSCLTAVRETLARFLTHGYSNLVYQIIKYQLSKAWEGGVGTKKRRSKGWSCWTGPRDLSAAWAQRWALQHSPSIQQVIAAYAPCWRARCCWAVSCAAASWTCLGQQKRPKCCLVS